MRLVGPALLLCTSGCLPFGASFHLHRLEGADSSPIPCHVRVHFGWQKATLTALPGGREVFTGSYPMVPTPPDRAMAPLWDRIYGTGYFTAKVLGSPQHVRVTLMAEGGRSIQMEVHHPPGSDRGGLEGVAVGPDGELYKVGL